LIHDLAQSVYVVAHAQDSLEQLSDPFGFMGELVFEDSQVGIEISRNIERKVRMDGPVEGIKPNRLHPVKNSQSPVARSISSRAAPPESGFRYTITTVAPIRASFPG